MIGDPDYDWGGVLFLGIFAIIGFVIWAASNNHDWIVYTFFGGGALLGLAAIIFD